MSAPRATFLVALREISVKLRDRTFLFTTAFFLLLTVVATVLPALLGGRGSTVAVAVPVAVAPLRAAGLNVRPVPDAASAERAVRDGDVAAAVVAGSGPMGIELLAMRKPPDDVVRALSLAPGVRLLDPNALDPVLNYLVPLAFGMVFFLTSLTFGLQIAQSITEEKQTRIVEILVAAVPPRVLMAGKILGNGALALAQIALISAVALVGVRSTHSDQLLRLLGPAIGWFIPFFVVGFILLASLWAVVGALVSRVEDVGGASLPVQLVVMAPFFAVIFLNDNPAAMRVMSYIPFSAPTAMPLRLFAGDAAWWEPFVALALLVATAGVFLQVGARLYEGSLLRTRGKMSLGAAWRQRDEAAARI